MNYNEIKFSSDMNCVWKIISEMDLSITVDYIIDGLKLV